MMSGRVSVTVYVECVGNYIYVITVIVIIS